MQNSKNSKQSTRKQKVQVLEKKKLVKAPAAQGFLVKSNPPQIRTMEGRSDGSVIVTHREYIKDIQGSATFVNTSQPIQPAIPIIFPWLSSIAARYEQYRFKKLHFCFETEKPTSSGGSLMMAVDYDASDAAALGKASLMSYYGAVRSPIWSECTFECDPRSLTGFGPRRFTRIGSLAGDQDIKTYDIGTFQIATQGCADASVIGELYVEYTIELYTPQIDFEAELAQRGESMSYTGTRTAPFQVLTSALGNLPLFVNPLGFIFREPGSWWIMIFVTGTVINPALFPTVTHEPADQLQSACIPIVNSAATNAVYQYSFRSSRTESYIQFQFLNMTTLTSTYTRICVCPYI